MKKIVLLAALASVFASQVQAAQRKPIYGVESRHEVYEAIPAHQEWARSTAVMVENYKFTPVEGKSGVFDLRQLSLKNGYVYQPRSFDDLEKNLKLCSDVKFGDQPIAGNCSGFLIAPDLIVTAGHCVDDFEIDACENNKWVFDYNVDKTTQTAGLNIKNEDIYSCKKIVTWQKDYFTQLDYAIIQLDRRVIGRAPLKVRTNGVVPEKEPVLVIGSPGGLPTKVAADAYVRQNSNPIFFETNLDTFSGNSGSGVFNAKTGTIEGILVRGETDYEENVAKGCVEPKVCKMDECMGEDVTRVTSIPEVAHYEEMMKAVVSDTTFLLRGVLERKTWIDFRTEDGQSPLIKAAAAGKHEPVRWLLAERAEINLQDAKGNAALHELSKNMKEAQIATLKLLVEKKANLELKNDLGETALLAAAKKLNTLAVEQLIALGADKNALDASGRNAAFAFVENNDVQAVLKLRELGVDIKPAMKKASLGMKIKVGLNQMTGSKKKKSPL